MSLFEVNDDTFESEILKAKQPVVIDFFADWCGPCKALMPIVEELASEKVDVKFVKVNVDKSPAIAQKYNIRGVPTIMIAIDGEIEGTKVGLITKSNLLTFIDTTI